VIKPEKVWTDSLQVNRLEGRWWTAFALLSIVFWLLIGWAVASLERAFDWSPEQLPFPLVIIVGLVLLGAVSAER